MKAPKRADVRAAWDEIRALALGCIEGSPYGNEAASMIVGTMDALVPEWAEAVPTPSVPMTQAPVSIRATEPAPPLPIVHAKLHWDTEWKCDGRGVSWYRGTLTHLATGLSDTSGWWLDSGDAHAEAAQGLSNQLALRYPKLGQDAPGGER